MLFSCGRGEVLLSRLNDRNAAAERKLFTMALPSTIRV